MKYGNMISHNDMRFESQGCLMYDLWHREIRSSCRYWARTSI